MSAICGEGEGADAALAKLFQEQEHAWFLANGGDPADFDTGDHMHEDLEQEASDADDHHASDRASERAEANERCVSLAW